MVAPLGICCLDATARAWAVPFDEDPGPRDHKRGSGAVIPAGIVCTVRSGSLGFQLSSTGDLVFVPADFDSKRVVSVGRDGSELALNLPPDRYSTPHVSSQMDPRLLVESQDSVIETLDLLRGTHAKLTAPALGTSFASWTADGQSVVFRRFNVPFWTAANGSGNAGPVPGERSTTIHRRLGRIPTPSLLAVFNRKP